MVERMLEKKYGRRKEILKQKYGRRGEILKGSTAGERNYAGKNCGRREKATKKENYERAR